MGRGSRNKKKKDSEIKCACVLFAEEDNTGLIQYLQKLAPDIMSNDLPPGELQAANLNAPAMLIPAAQEIIFRVIHMIIRELDDGLYFETISETNIVITSSDLPKIVRNTLKKASADSQDANNQKMNNIHSLREMLDRVLTATSPLYFKNRRVNPELSHLLGLMRGYQSGKCLFLIRYHFSLLPLSNRSVAYIQMYDHTMEILRYNDPIAYMVVLEGVDTPADWYTRCLGNKYLADSFQRGDYDIHGTSKPWSTEMQLLPLKYLRNRPSHAQEGAASPLAPNGMKFCPSDLARAFYIRMPNAFISLQKAVHSVGELQNLSFVNLFPGRLTIPKNH